jgi:phage terminase large subunit
MPEIQINAVYQQLFKNGRLRPDIRYFIIYGGRRSAKSHDIAQILGITALSEPRHFIPIIRKVGATIKDSVYAEHADFYLRNNIPVEFNKTDKEIRLPNQSRFRGFGLDDAEKLKSLKGATIFHHEEANEETEEDFDSLDAGLSPSEYPGQHILTFNPIPQIPGSMHWLQRRFLQIPHELSKAVIFDTPTGKALVLRTWYKDNAFCPEATKKVLEGYKLSNPEKYKLWALGEFTRLEGVVFSKWDIVDEVPPEVAPESIGVGLDFGFGGDPSAALRVWIRESTREIWIKQLVYSTDLYNDMLYNKLVEHGVGLYEEVTADSARPDIIGDLYRMGLNGIKGVKKYSGYKEDIAMRLQGYQIHVTKDSTDAIKEISTYSWARDKNGKQLPKLQDGDDHSMDCLLMKLSEHTGEYSILDVV